MALEKQRLAEACGGAPEHNDVEAIAPVSASSGCSDTTTLRCRSRFSESNACHTACLMTWIGHNIGTYTTTIQRAHKPSLGEYLQQRVGGVEL